MHNLQLLRKEQKNYYKRKHSSLDTLVRASVLMRVNGISKFSTVYQWNSLIREAVSNNKPHESLLLFRQMKREGFEPNNLTFPFISKACGKIFDPKCSQTIHTHVLKSEFWSDVFVQTAMVDMYIKCSGLNYAHTLFDRMPVRDVASWNAILGGYSQLGCFEKVLSIFQEMRISGFRPDSVTVMGVSKVISCAEDLKLMKAIHCFGIRIGIDGDVSVANTWISSYARCLELELSELVFCGIDKGFQTVVSWNSLIAGYANCGDFISTITLYKSMLCDGFRPDISTILNLISSCQQPEALLQGNLIHCHGIKFGCNYDGSVTNTLISMYCKCGDIVSARYLFDSMSYRTCVSWTAMISGYAEKADIDEALKLFNDMESTSEKPDLVTVLCLISGCGQTASLELGKWVERYANINGLKDIVIVNALIDMYAKCGSVCDSRRLFYAMYDKTVVSWTTMIDGCAMNGEFEEALKLFDQMLNLGLQPNHITFLAVLQACIHGGFLEKGLEFFNLMTTKFKINPGLDHYSCVADLLGRRGELNQALSFLQKMPVKPDGAMWSTLLSACKNHPNVEIGEYVAQQVLKLEPDVAAPYVEIANVYASLGMWESVARTRSMMKSNKMRKFPGQSIVQVDGVSNVFTVEDRGHADGLLIYAVLDSLRRQSDKMTFCYIYGFVELESDSHD